MPKKLILALIGFHISALVSLIFAGALAYGLKEILLVTGQSVGSESDQFAALGNALVSGMVRTAWITVSVPALWAIALESIPWGLRKGKYGAWVVGIIFAGLQLIAGIYLIGTPRTVGPMEMQPCAPGASVLEFARWLPLPLAALALWGLLDANTVIAFSPRGLCTDAANIGEHTGSNG